MKYEQNKKRTLHLKYYLYLYLKTLSFHPKKVERRVKSWTEVGDGGSGMGCSNLRGFAKDFG